LEAAKLWSQDQTSAVCTQAWQGHVPIQVTPMRIGLWLQTTDLQDPGVFQFSVLFGFIFVPQATGHSFQRFAFSVTPYLDSSSNLRWDLLWTPITLLHFEETCGIMWFWGLGALLRYWLSFLSLNCTFIK
jgi:hypothetical protein